jgi:hypothetical protein
MSALFRWPARTPPAPPEVGAQRIVAKTLLLPKCLDGEWRWLGCEVIKQECLRRWSHGPEGIASFQYNGWIDRHWAN